MNLLKDEYIILELIPTAIHPSKGDIIQLSALKLKGLQLQERFDERLEERLIALQDFKDLINYDKDSFKYKESTKEILSDFEEWSNNLPLLILDNAYTNNFLESLSNKKESILKYLNKEYHDQIVEELIEENNIEPTDYIVDILYESLIKHL
jgi:DNA polymerase III alpha subunit (gram-positive type)